MPVSPSEKEQKLKLLEIVRQAQQTDNALREKFQMGEKFRFVRDQIATLLDQIEKHVQLITSAEEKKIAASGVAEDEVTVYVYLYNAQGIVLSTWHNMLTPKLFYEYSVNRPIYANKAHIESLVHSKATRTQHAYLVVTVKQAALINQAENAKSDALGNPILKVKEGSLHFDRLLAFVHNDIEYIVDEHGHLVRKV